MPVTDALLDREIVSESGLTPDFLSEMGLWREPDWSRAVLVDAEGIDRIMNEWRSAIEQGSNQITKYVARTLIDLPTGCIYDRLDEADWRIAAGVAEVFRNPSVSKNAGRLDTCGLQRIVHERLKGDAPLQFVIAWGQPKRDAGGFKTLGPMADLAEGLALARLATILRAIERISGRNAHLTILTGGSRYFEALFTRPDLVQVYDQQRQRIADALCRSREITLLPFAVARPVIPDPGVVDSVDGAMISAKFHTILLNIDWTNVLAPKSENPVLQPHGISLPPTLAAWLEASDESARKQLVRSAILGLVNPRLVSASMTSFANDEQILEDALSFMQQVAWESTRKYIAIQFFGDGNVEGARSSGAIWLTVHEKRARRDVPAILTLGVRGGNLLSQHVLAVVGRAGSVSFSTYAELQRRDVVQVNVSVDEKTEDFLFNWLAGASQPLCFLDSGLQDQVAAIAAASVDKPALAPLLQERVSDAENAS